MATNATTEVTALDVERYIQLHALWLLATHEWFADLTPDLLLDNVDISIKTPDGESYSLNSLIRKVLPEDGTQDEREAELINARMDMFAARLFREAAGFDLEGEAARFDVLASNALKKAAA